MNTKQVTYETIVEDSISIAIVELDKNTYVCRVEREVQDDEWVLVSSDKLQDFINQTRQAEIDAANKQAEYDIF